MTFSAGSKLRASQLNLIDLLKQAQKDFISTAQTTTSVTTYADLTTVGPELTITSKGSLALVYISAFIEASAAHNAQASVDISGDTIQSATTTANNGLIILNANGLQIVSSALDIIDITPGTNTYKMMYTNSGTQTATFADRKLVVMAP